MALTLGVFGAAGRVGRALVDACCRDPAVDLRVAIGRDASSALGTDVGVLAGVGAMGVPLSPLESADLSCVEVLIDFTLPEATLMALEACIRTHTAMVIGTTGFGPDALERIRAASERVAIVHAPNMSVGVNICFKVLETIASAAGDDFDVEIIEAHHRHKIDAPSGTAIRMGEVVARSLGRDLHESAVYSREGRTGARPRNAIGFATVRAGDIVGEHTVLFAGEGERLELTHRSSSRTNYARGAVRAAKWVTAKPPGLYAMTDVLDLG